MTTVPPLNWTQFGPFWLSEGGRYVILHSVLPELRDNPTEIYTVRKRDPASARANPSTLGYHLAERYTLFDAKQEAQRDAWKTAQGASRHVPADYPAAAIARFYWPISDGCSQAALVIVHCDGGAYAQVVGMSRDDRPITDPTGKRDSYQPGIYAEIKLNPALIHPRESELETDAP